jgi:dTMP kinase
MARGRFITFEGIDGAGKSTQMAFVARMLKEHGVDVLLTREPGGTPVGEKLRELVLHETMTARTETLLMFAARAEHVDTVIEPALAGGRWVLCDRFTDATFAYQGGGRSIDPELIAVLEWWVHPKLQPDTTFLFDIDPQKAAERLAAAHHADRFETEHVEFFTRVRDSYRRRAKLHAHRFALVDSSRPVHEVQQALQDMIEGWFK